MSVSAERSNAATVVDIGLVNPSSSPAFAQVHSLLGLRSIVGTTRFFQKLTWLSFNYVYSLEWPWSLGAKKMVKSCKEGLDAKQRRSEGCSLEYLARTFHC